MSNTSCHPICIKNQYENNNILGLDTSELRFGSVQNLVLELETRPLTEAFRIHVLTSGCYSQCKRAVHILLECFLVTAPKQSLGQSTVFKPFFCSQGDLCMMSLPVWLPGPMFLLGGLSLWSHVHSRGSLSRGLCLGGSLARGSLPGRRAEKHEIYAAKFGSHLFYDLFLQGRVGGRGHGPLGPPPGSATDSKDRISGNRFSVLATV